MGNEGVSINFPLQNTLSTYLPSILPNLGTRHLLLRPGHAEVHILPGSCHRNGAPAAHRRFGHSGADADHAAPSDPTWHPEVHASIGEHDQYGVHAADVAKPTGDGRPSGTDHRSGSEYDDGNELGKKKWILEKRLLSLSNSNKTNIYITLVINYTCFMMSK